MARMFDPVDNGTFRDNLNSLAKEMKFKNDMELLSLAAGLDKIPIEQFADWISQSIKTRFGGDISVKSNDVF